MSLHQLVETQRQYYKTGEPTKLSHRREQLLKLRKILKEDHDTLTEGVYKDLRRDKRTTFGLEVGNAIVEIDYMLENLEEWSKPVYAEKTLTTALDTPMIYKEAKGVVLLISPWNYPVSMVVLPLIPIIAAGNTVIIKPSEISAHTSEALDTLFSKNFDRKFLAVVQGGVQETTELLKERFDHIIYTGATTVGRIVMSAAAKHLTPVTLELGGKCPVVIESDADIETSAKRVAWGKWLNCGQTCLAPDYIITTAALKPRVVAGLRKAIIDFYGTEIKASKDYSRIIGQRHFDRIKSLLDRTNATVLFKNGEPDRDDLFIPPVILDAKPEDVFMEDEIFGPILPIITVSGFDEAIEFIRDGEKPLAAYLFTRDQKKIQRFLNETSSGGVTINDVLMHITVDTIPFGGVGNSGMGRYRGKFGFDTFTHEKAVLKRGFFGESLLDARYPPQSDAKFKQLKKITGSRVGVPKIVKKLFPALPYIIFGVIMGFIAQRYGGHYLH
uniref:Aldehyde dehydrogenase n=1 Tax=Acrobeloides nanus TaxID=290746 RepID=A0A914C976_9BILA